MIFKRFFPLFFLIFFVQIQAQNSNAVLFTIDKEPVYSDEFLKIFNKNRAIVEDENKKSIEEYLELYINYKLKLKQAYSLKLDTVSSYRKELKKYRSQLVAPYLKDSKVTDALLHEAYDRMKTEVRASHILIRLNPKASPQDTLKAYNKIINARNKILNGASFEAIAKQYSEDPSAQQNGGDLGYFSVFGMVYPFENAAYKGEIGDVSMPFKTSFGYHIVRVTDKRESKGEVEVAHIMIKNDTTNREYAERQIKEVYAKLQQGDAFDFLAKQYSDDKASAIRGGKLRKFTAAKMIKSFSDVAFSLENEKDISKPFKTVYGWHIVQLIKKYPIKSFEELKEGLIKRIENSERASIVGKSIANRLKKEYKIELNENSYHAFLVNDTVYTSKNKNNAIFSINGNTIKLSQLLDYSKTQRNKVLSDIYTSFLDTQVINYFKNNLENTDSDFAFIMQEYRDGLLLFDLLQKKIWTRSEKDTIALEEYFNKNRQNYVWKERADLIIATCTDSIKAALVKNYLKANKNIEEIKELVNEGATINVLFSNGILEIESDKLPKGFLFLKGVSKIYNDDNSHFVIVKVNEIIEPTQKKLNEAKGKVINDFQQYLEKQWIDDLKLQYKVKVRKAELKRVIKNNSI
jgi:peptidyl-prolyl cis-trans isomerase SurA